jgi:hypothetical protein
MHCTKSAEKFLIAIMTDLLTTTEEMSQGNGNTVQLTLSDEFNLTILWEIQASFRSQIALNWTVLGPTA